MKIKKGVIPIVSLAIGIIIFEIIAIYIFNWTGIFRIILAGLIGGAAYSMGRNIEKKIIKTSEPTNDNKLINIIGFLSILIIVVGINFLSKNKTSSQIINHKQEKIKLDNIINKLTDKHVYIPTTKIYIIPPKGYRFIEELQRFQKDDKTYIQIVEMQNVDFNKNELSQENFKAKGAKVFEWKEFLMNNYSTKLGIIQGDYTSKNIFCAFGDKSFSAMLIGYCLLNDTTSENEIIKSIKSIYYDTTKTIDYFSLARFEIDISDTEYIFVQYASNTYSYAKDGIITENPLQTQFMISQVPSMGVDNNSLSNYSLSLIESHEQQGLNIDIKKSEPIVINGFNGYLIEGESQFQNKDVAIYQLVISNYSSTVVFTGMAGEDIENDRKLFKKISKRLKIKE